MRVDLTNKTFGNLTAIKRIGEYWLCKCTCGNKCQVRASNLNAGFVLSCGCVKRMPAVIEKFNEQGDKIKAESKRLRELRKEMKGKGYL
jgi:hypothetical protein